ncbi:hypothetical protein J4466_05560 [Candidatus Pacearchaeota archaeon]|nr:hypothetical protein [Candidatus Pacearchaeota archaeon]
MTLKPLKPSMKENKRYLLLKGSFSKSDVEEAVLKYIGILGYAKAAPMWVSDRILAVNRKEVDKVRASFVLSKGKIEVAKVSGTIRGLRKK